MVLYCVCSLLLMLHCSVSGTTLTITPSQVHIGGVNPSALNGTCSPPTGATAVFSITIGRKLHTALPGDPGLEMVAINTNVNNDEPQIKDGTLRSRLIVQGDIKSASKFLRFSLSDPTCNDLKGYTFYCNTLFFPSSAGNSEAVQNVTYRVNPDNIRMVVFPSYETYDPGTLVTFTCTGLIGSEFPTDQSNFWVWQWRDVSQVIPTSWVRYPYSNITYGNPTAAANCNNNGRSELRHTVTQLDNGRQFRCYVVNPELYSGNATIYTEENTTPGGPGVGGDMSGTTLTITPSQVHIGGVNPSALNGTCSPPTGTTDVFSITIGRKLHTALPGETGLELVLISLGQNNDEPQILDGILRSRLTVQGDIKSASNFLRFSLSDPTCNDLNGYTFYCNTQFLPVNAGNQDAVQNVTYRVNPDNIRMVVFPSYETYDPGTLVTFTCTGLIGSEFPTDQSNFWVWQWRDVSQAIPTSWVRYPYSNITYGNPTAAFNCNNNGRSELRHTVTQLDNGRQFRCYIVIPGLYSGNATIYTEENTTPGGPVDGDGGKSSTFLGLAIGLPVGVILFAVVLGVLIAWKLRGRRSSMNETPLYDVPNHDAETENRYQGLILNDDTRQQGQEMQNSPDVVYETPQQEIKTQNSSSVQYENIENVEQAQISEASEVQYGNINRQSENINQDYLSAVFERP